MADMEIKIHVDTSELDAAIEKAEHLVGLLDQIEGNFRDDSRKMTIIYDQGDQSADGVSRGAATPCNPSD